MLDLLEKVIAEIKVLISSEDRRDALLEIQEMIDDVGPYQFCKSFNVLSNNSAEDFMIEFMISFNKECFPCY